MRNETLQELAERYERFVKDMAFIFLFNVVGTVLIVLSLFVPTYGLFLLLMSIGATCTGMAIAQQLIMLHRIYRGTKWKKE